MSLLQVQKKAETDRDVETLIQDTMNLRDPFGIPTLFITDADFHHVNFAGVNADKKIHKRIRKKIVKAPTDFRRGYDRAKDIYRAHDPHLVLERRISSSVKRVLGVGSNAYAVMVALPYYGQAHTIHRQQLVDAQCAVAILSSHK